MVVVLYYLIIVVSIGCSIKHCSLDNYDLRA